MISLNDAVKSAGLKGRLMKLSPLMPWRPDDLWLVTGLSSVKANWRSRAQIITAVNIKSGKSVSIEVDVGFPLTLFSRRL